MRVKLSGLTFDGYDLLDDHRNRVSICQYDHPPQRRQRQLVRSQQEIRQNVHNIWHMFDVYFLRGFGL